jgi:hypothetical protein
MSKAPFERTRQRTPSLFVGRLSGLQGHMEARLSGLQGHFQGVYRDDKDTMVQSVALLSATTRTSRPRWVSKNRHDQHLAGVEATFGMRGAGSGLLASTPPRPGQHAGGTARKRKEESAKQTADFRHAQRNGERGSLVGLDFCTRESLFRTDDRQHR